MNNKDDWKIVTIVYDTMATIVTEYYKLNVNNKNIIADINTKYYECCFDNCVIKCDYHIFRDVFVDCRFENSIISNK